MLAFSEDEWTALIPSIGFRRFIRSQKSAQEKICDQQLRIAARTGYSRPSMTELKPAVNNMPSVRPITSFFSRKAQEPIVCDRAMESLDQAAMSETSSCISGCKESVSAADIEKFIYQLGMNQSASDNINLAYRCHSQVEYRDCPWN